MKDYDIFGLKVLLEKIVLFPNDLAIIGLNEAIIDELSYHGRVIYTCFLNEQVDINIDSFLS